METLKSTTQVGRKNNWDVIILNGIKFSSELSIKKKCVHVRCVLNEKILDNHVLFAFRVGPSDPQNPIRDDSHDGSMMRAQ